MLWISVLAQKKKALSCDVVETLIPMCSFASVRVLGFFPSIPLPHN